MASDERQWRALTADELAVLERLISAAPSGRAELASQLPHVLAREWDCSAVDRCGSIELKVDGGVPAASLAKQNGPLAVAGRVDDDDGLPLEVLVFTDHGWLLDLEIVVFSDRRKRPTLADAMTVSARV